MTRFLFITDTHLGAENDVGYRQQPRRADRLPALVDLLDVWIERDAAIQRAAGGAPISFVLHGGDMIDAATPALVCEAAIRFQMMGVPVYLSLGNHDVTDRRALDLWLSEALAFFPTERPSFTLSGDGWALHVLPTNWCDTPYYWDATQDPHLLSEDLARLERALDARPDALHLLCTHGDVLAVPPAQVGQPDPYHAPPLTFTTTVTDLLRRFPQLRGVLGGHNHVNTHSLLAQAHVVTGSAFAETPFEFKVVDIARAGWSMRTVALLPEVPFQADYDWDRTFVQGRRCDRAFVETF